MILSGRCKALRVAAGQISRTVHVRHPKLQSLHTKAVPRNNQFLTIGNHVREALEAGRPVVSLETTIYTHGFPYPDNIDLATDIERLVRENGAIPATIGVLDGRAIVGMTKDEIELLLSEANSGVNTIKLSRRDLGYVAGQGHLGKRVNGGTTIAGTLVLSHLAGIQVFATGGLGGVHKGGEVSMDVSADLTELGRTPVALVSSGCKSFLDIPRTLEYLETQGVCVGTFADGRSGNVDFPAFWTRNSGTPSPRTIHDEEEAAAIIYGQTRLGLQSGLLFANPIAEKYSLGKEEMDKAMARAVQDAKDAGVTGHANTPYVLSRIRDITEGKTIAANRELVFSNVIRGAKVARHLSKLQGEQRRPYSVSAVHQRLNSSQNETSPAGSAPRHPPPESESKIVTRSQGQDTVLPDEANRQSSISDLVIYGHSAASDMTADSEQTIVCNLGDETDVLVVGSVACDLACDILEGEGSKQTWVSETSNRAKITESIGGVGANIATAACLAGAKTTFKSSVGQDASGQMVKTELANNQDLRADITVSLTHPTARYVAFNKAEDKALVMAAADMSIFEQAPSFTRFSSSKGSPSDLKWLVLDGNLSSRELNLWISSGIARKVAFEPVSEFKATRLVDALLRTSPVATDELQGKPAFSFATVDLITPNRQEVRAMAAKINAIARSHGAVNDLVFHGALKSQIIRHIKEGRKEGIDSLLLDNALQALNVSRCVMVTLGPEGVLMVKRIKASDPLRKKKGMVHCVHLQKLSASKRNKSTAQPDEYVYIRQFPSTIDVDPATIVSVNGAGDTFTGVLVAGLSVENPQTEDALVMLAQSAAVKTLHSSRSVSPDVKELAELLRPGHVFESDNPEHGSAKNESLPKTSVVRS